MPLALTLATSGSRADHACAADLDHARAAMVATIRAHATGGPQPIGERVLDAVGRVPRHEFVPTELAARAYDDRALPIGHGQTISQPYIVALMTELAAVEAGDRVLEIGTGSGYQAAVLGELAGRVYSIEIVEPLGRAAGERLRRLGYENVETKIGDGYAGWREHAPFDAILVTAAPERIPEPLLEQLAPGGKLVAPVGSHRFVQQLVVVDKDASGVTSTRQLLAVQFVPFTRRTGRPER